MPAIETVDNEIEGRADGEWGWGRGWGRVQGLLEKKPQDSQTKARGGGGGARLPDLWDNGETVQRDRESQEGRKWEWSGEKPGAICKREDNYFIRYRNTKAKQDQQQFLNQRHT